MTPTESNTEQQAPRRVRLPDGVPSVYADQVMDVIYGFHTTKLVFGVEQGLDQGAVATYENIRPVGVVVMPTPMLLGAAMRLLEQITAPALVQQTSERYRSVVETMEAIGQLVRSANELIASQTPAAEGSEPAGGPDGGQG